MKVKRIFDLFAGIVLVGVLAGPICFIALCVRLTSRGPILHWSKRKGINNVDFMMPKFRSMIVNAPIVSSEGMTNQESYFTPIGRFLRKYSLDEFPQLFSVLKGNMSFVGPRPALYSQENLILFRREAGVDQILPGVTGWAQVNGRNLMTVEDKVCYDLDYMKRQSILFDLKILYKTIFKPIKAGAYEYSDFTCWPAYTLEEANAVRDVVLSNKTNAFIGKKNKEFEQNFSLFCGIKYAATTTSGSTALELALKSLGVETGDEVIVTEFGFIMHRIYASLHNAKVVLAKEKNFKASVEEVLKKVTNKTKIVFIANPNNPTGTYLSKNEMLNLRKKLRSDILLVVDDAYFEFLNLDDFTSGLDLFKDSNNVLITRTFSKIYGLAGLRLGWGYSSKDIIDAMYQIKPPFNVNRAALSAGITAINDDEWTKKAIEHNTLWSNKIFSVLKEYKIQSNEPSANFFLMNFHEIKINSDNAFEKLASKRLILRKMTQYKMPDALRITIGNEEANKHFIKSLGSVFK